MLVVAMALTFLIVVVPNAIRHSVPTGEWSVELVFEGIMLVLQSVTVAIGLGISALVTRLRRG